MDIYIILDGYLYYYMDIYNTRWKSIILDGYIYIILDGYL